MQRDLEWVIIARWGSMKYLWSSSSRFQVERVLQIEAWKYLFRLERDKGTNRDIDNPRIWRNKNRDVAQIFILCCLASPLLALFVSPNSCPSSVPTAHNTSIAGNICGYIGNIVPQKSLKKYSKEIKSEHVQYSSMLWDFSWYLKDFSWSRSRKLARPWKESVESTRLNFSFDFDLSSAGLWNCVTLWPLAFSMLSWIQGNGNKNWILNIFTLSILHKVLVSCPTR